MASDWGMCFACTNSIKLTAPDTKTPLGSSIVSNKRSPKKPLHSRSKGRVERPQIPAARRLSPFLLTRMAIRLSEEEERRGARLCGERGKKQQPTEPATAAMGGKLAGCAVRTRCIGRGRYFMVLDILQTRDRR